LFADDIPSSNHLSSAGNHLRAADADLKTAQELLRHANSRITLDVD
jgi:hypothetical protein